MQNEIDVGEYVRTKNGVIDKVDALYGMIANTVHLENQKWFDIKNIVKHSKQLIDLIEVGDVVNKLEIFRVEEYNENYDAKVVYHETDEEAIPIATDEIETVLTHEQYEANCYKVGGEDE